jgi:hypothetical protein
MAITTDLLLKGYFQTGNFPTESNFDDLIDSKLLKTGANAVLLDTITEATTNNGVQIETVVIQDNLIAQGTAQTEGYVMRKYDIGTWDMNRSVGGDILKTVVLDGAMKNPESVNIVIIRDDGSYARSLEGSAGATWNTDGSGDILMTVTAAGVFDNGNYNGATNRGFVVVTKWTTLV